MGNSSSIADSLLFPAPQSSYGTDLPCIIWIDEDFSMSSHEKHSDGALRSRKFPCLFFTSPSATKHTFLYWHGNSCDLGQIYEELEILSTFLNCNICAIEYPGYGLMNDITANNEIIDKWSRAAFNFLVWMKIPPQCIICFGRSIGTGPACKLASSLKEIGVYVGAVVLHAPYISIHKIIDEYVAIGSWFIGNYWNNQESLSKLSPDCPVLIIHGLDDEIIPTEHGKNLYDSYSSQNKEGFFPADSSHNSYYVIDDIGEPIKLFLQKKSRSHLYPEIRVAIPDYFYSAPSYINSKFSKTHKDDNVIDETDKNSTLKNQEAKHLPKKNESPRFVNLLKSGILNNEGLSEIMKGAFEAVEEQGRNNSV